jgi:copper homeostasis protein (lipoprotein)
MRTVTLAALIPIIALTLGCAMENGSTNEQLATKISTNAELSKIIEPPVSFAGTIPCASCPGIRMTLTLMPDHTFRLRQTYVGAKDGEDDTFHDFGRWALTDEGRMLILFGGIEPPQRFGLKSLEALNMLSSEGEPIRSELNYELDRTAQIDLISEPMRLRGIYRYMADAGLFVECHSGKSFFVAQEGDNATLESAYIAARPEPGAEVLVTITGHIARRPKMEGEGEVEMVVVDKFGKVWPGDTCLPKSEASLTDTHWKVLELQGRPLKRVEQGREVHMVLASEGNRAHGFAGCNRFFGGFQSDRNTLRFSPLGSTRMACPSGMDQEQPFLNALERAGRYEIHGQVLELYAGELLLARFEAAVFKTSSQRP